MRGTFCGMKPGLLELNDKTVVITGASGGIGRAAAITIARQGARVALLARGEAGLAGAKNDIDLVGGQSIAIPVDVSDADAVDRAAEQVEAELGPIDIWVNVAFSAVFARFDEISPDEYRRATEVSYLGYVYGTMAALKRMRARNRGTIVQVGSALAYRGIPLQTAYCGAKHAIQGFNESLRCELLHEKSGIKTTIVQMPALNTTQFTWVLSRLPDKAQPVPPIYQPEVGGRAIAWAAAHPRRREYWVGASTVATLLGNAVAPGLLDRYLARTGFAAQQTGEPRPEDQPVNLWHPADQSLDRGYHGEFDRRSKRRSPQLWASKHHWALSAAGAATLAVATAAAAHVIRKADD